MMHTLKYMLWGVVILMLVLIIIWIFSLFGVITVNAESALDHIRAATELLLWA